jgi:hypothetical protein
MLRSVLKRPWLKRFAHGSPVVALLLAADMSVLAVRHLARLSGAQQRRLLALVFLSRGRPSVLSASERRELSALLLALEPRLFIGSAIRRLSPMPVPRRLLYGPRGSAARIAAAQRRR